MNAFGTYTYKEALQGATPDDTFEQRGAHHLWVTAATAMQGVVVRTPTLHMLETVAVGDTVRTMRGRTDGRRLDGREHQDGLAAVISIPAAVLQPEPRGWRRRFLVTSAPHVS